MIPAPNLAGADRRPNFMFIGSSKCGSSWFFEILREHPQVFVPPNKATFFFTDNYFQGVNWYEAFFLRATSELAIGEVCHDYLGSPEALRRIRNYRPDIRFVCCLRNPYARALSSWRFFRRNGMDRPTLAAQGESDPSVFEHGNYATQLTALKSIFPENQLLIFFFEELSSAPDALARRLYEFLGVDAGFRPPSLHTRVNVNARPRSRVLARVVQHVHKLSWKNSRRLSNLIGSAKQIRPLRRFVRAALYKESVNSSDWRDHIGEFPEHIVARYEREITDLEKLLGKDLSDWHARPGHGANRGEISPLMKPALKSAVVVPITETISHRVPCGPSNSRDELMSRGAADPLVSATMPTDSSKK